jgi:hypothetical protein
MISEYVLIWREVVVACLTVLIAAVTWKAEDNNENMIDCNVHQIRIGYLRVTGAQYYRHVIRLGV